MIDKDEESKALFGCPAADLTPVQARDLEEHLAAKERLANPLKMAEDWWRSIVPEAIAKASEGKT